MFPLLAPRVGLDACLGFHPADQQAVVHRCAAGVICFAWKQWFDTLPLGVGQFMAVTQGGPPWPKKIISAMPQTELECP